MSELHLQVTENLYHESENIHAELSTHLKISKPRIISLRSFDPPSWIQLLGDAVAWQPLYAAAVVFCTAYVATLGKKAAETTWDKICKREDVKPLADVAITLATRANSIGGEVQVVVGLDIPDDYFGTAIAIDPSDPEEVARVLASFVVHADQLSEAMKTEIGVGRIPAARAVVTLQDDGGLLVQYQVWEKNGNEINRYELKIPRSEV